MSPDVAHNYLLSCCKTLYISLKVAVERTKAEIPTVVASAQSKAGDNAKRNLKSLNGIRTKVLALNKKAKSYPKLRFPLVKIVMTVS